MRWIDEITLDEVAAAASTTRQTVIRLFGGKQGVLEAVVETLPEKAAPRISAPRDIPGRTALQALLAHYEAVGDITLRLLAQEERHPSLRATLDRGRREHRAWVAALFDAALRDLDGAERERQITRLVVATDLYTWKLLRRDLGRGRGEVAVLMSGMIRSLIGERPT
ncbi:MAG TPA: hypothetical protein VME40_02335 [Caulobacteraceae bacterium]|nr:hypothetical protein [Caulobacteraceae bacterium]